MLQANRSSQHLKKSLKLTFVKKNFKQTHFLPECGKEQSEANHYCWPFPPFYRPIVSKSSMAKTKQKRATLNISDIPNCASILYFSCQTATSFISQTLTRPLLPSSDDKSRMIEWWRTLLRFTFRVTVIGCSTSRSTFDSPAVYS